MAARIRKTFRAFVIALALVVAFAYVAGARTVFVYREFRCAPGYVASPVSIAYAYECRPPTPDPTAIQWPEAVTTRDEVALYLANFHVRVFHMDFAAGTTYWLAFDVAAPPYR
jgi:hypothetical protein